MILTQYARLFSILPSQTTLFPGRDSEKHTLTFCLRCAFLSVTDHQKYRHGYLPMEALQEAFKGKRSSQTVHVISQLNSEHSLSFFLLLLLHLLYLNAIFLM